MTLTGGAPIKTQLLSQCVGGNAQYVIKISRKIYHNKSCLTVTDVTEVAEIHAIFLAGISSPLPRDTFLFLIHFS